MSPSGRKRKSRDENMQKVSSKDFQIGLKRKPTNAYELIKPKLKEKKVYTVRS